VGEVERVNGGFGTSFGNFQKRVHDSADSPRHHRQQGQNKSEKRADQLELHEEGSYEDQLELETATVPQSASESHLDISA
jgi:ribosomal protein L9